MSEEFQFDINEAVSERVGTKTFFGSDVSNSGLDFQSTLDGSKIEPQVLNDDDDGFLDFLSRTRLLTPNAVTNIKNRGGIPNLKTSWNENHEKLIQNFSLSNTNPNLNNQLKDSLTRNRLNEFIGSNPIIKNIIESDKDLESEFNKLKKSHSRFRRTDDSEEKAQRLENVGNDLLKFQQKIIEARDKLASSPSFYRNMAVNEYIAQNPEMVGKVSVKDGKLFSSLSGKERLKLNEEIEELTEKYEESSNLSLSKFAEKGKSYLEGNVEQQKEMGQLKGEEDAANEEALEEPKAFDQNYTYVIGIDGQDVHIVPRDLGTASKDLWLGKAYQEVKFAGEGTFSPTLFENFIGKNEVIHSDGRRFRLRKWITPIDLNGETVVPDMYYFDEIPEYGNVNGGSAGVYMQSLAADMAPPMAMNAVTTPLLAGGPLGWAGYVAANTGTGWASNTLAQNIRIESGIQREFNQLERAASALLSNLAFINAPKNFLKNANNISKLQKDLIFNATNSAIQGGVANTMYQYGEMSLPDSDIYGTDKFKLDQLALSGLAGGALGSGFTILGKLFKKPDDVARFVQDRRILNEFEERLPVLEKELKEAEIASKNDPENGPLKQELLDLQNSYSEFKTQLTGLRSSNSQYIADLIDETKKLDDFEAPDFQRTFKESTGNVDADIQGYLTDLKNLQNEYSVNKAVFETLNDYIKGAEGAKIGDSGLPEFAQLNSKRKSYITAIRDKAEKTLEKRELEAEQLNKQFNEDVKNWEEAGAELNAQAKDSEVKAPEAGTINLDRTVRLSSTSSDVQTVRPFSLRSNEDKAKIVSDFITKLDKSIESGEQLNHSEIVKNLNIAGIDQFSEIHKFVKALAESSDEVNLSKATGLPIPALRKIQEGIAKNLSKGGKLDGLSADEVMQKAERISGELAKLQGITDMLTTSQIIGSINMLKSLDLNDPSSVAKIGDQLNRTLQYISHSSNMRSEWGRRGKEMQEVSPLEGALVQETFDTVSKRLRDADSGMLKLMADGDASQDQINEFLKKRVHLGNFKNELQLMKTIEDPKEFVDTLIKLGGKHGSLHGRNQPVSLIVEYYANAILSAPPTQILGALSNSVNTLYQSAARAVGASTLALEHKVRGATLNLMGRNPERAMQYIKSSGEFKDVAKEYALQSLNLMSSVSMRQRRFSGVVEIAARVARGEQEGLTSQTVLQDLGKIDNFTTLVLDDTNPLKQVLYNAREGMNVSVKQMSFVDEFVKQVNVRSLLAAKNQVNFGKTLMNEADENKTAFEVLGLSLEELKKLKIDLGDEIDLEAVSKYGSTGLNAKMKKELLAVSEAVRFGRVFTPEGRFKSDADIKVAALKETNELYPDKLKEDPEEFIAVFRNNYENKLKEYTDLTSELGDVGDLGNFQAKLTSSADFSKMGAMDALDPVSSLLNAFEGVADKLVKIKSGGGNWESELGRLALGLGTPFVRTPTNIFKEIHKTIPASEFPIVNRLLGQGTYGKMMSGKFDDKGIKISDPKMAELRGKAVLGAGIWSTGYGLVNNFSQENSDGERLIITGAISKNKSIVSDLNSDGFSPYSFTWVKDGKDGTKIVRSISYNRLDPIGAILGFQADLRDLMEDSQFEIDPEEREKLWPVIKAFTDAGQEATLNLITSRNYLQLAKSLSDASKLTSYEISRIASRTGEGDQDALLHAKVGAYNIGKDIARGFNPAIVRLFQKTVDSKQRTGDMAFDGLTAELFEALKNVHPVEGLKREVRRNVFGEPLDNNLHISSAIFPSSIKGAKQDLTHFNLLKLYANTNERIKEPPTRPLKFGGKVDLRLKDFFGTKMPKDVVDIITAKNGMSPYSFYQNKISEVRLTHPEAKKLKDSIRKDFGFDAKITAGSTMRQNMENLFTSVGFKEVLDRSKETRLTSTKDKTRITNKLIESYRKLALTVVADEYPWMANSQKFIEAYTARGVDAKTLKKDLNTFTEKTFQAIREGRELKFEDLTGSSTLQNLINN